MLPLLTAGLLIALLAAADDTDPEPKAKVPKADVRGQIKAVERSTVDVRVTMLVKGVKEKDTGHDQAVVRLDAGTKVYRWKGGKKTKATLGELKFGVKVQCVFSEFKKSDPVQALASEVLILDEPKKK